MKNRLLFFIGLLLIGASPAHAYIDPGSGSAIMSVIIGFFVAAGVLIKTFWYKIAGFLGLSKKKNKKPSKGSQKKDKE